MEERQKVSWVHSLATKIALLSIIIGVVVAAVCIVCALVFSRSELTGTSSNYVLSMAEFAAHVVESDSTVDSDTEVYEGIFDEFTLEGADSAYAYLVAQDGTMLYHPTAEKIGQPVENEVISGVVQSLAAGTVPKPEAVTYLYNGAWKYAAYVVTDDMRIVVVTADRDEFLAGISRMQMILIILAVVCAIVSIIAGLVFGRVICGPIIRLSGHAKDVAEGRIDTEISRMDNGSEIAVLQNSFCDMIENFRLQSEIIHQLADGDLSIHVTAKSSDDAVGTALAQLVTGNNSVLTNVRSAAEEMDKGSNQIADASRNLANGATQQASAVQQISASVTDIANKTRDNAVEVEEVRKLVLEAEKNISSGNLKMNEMVEAMQEISEASRNIQSVIKVIDDIAFNTNILALNASVEASRAGDQGKGFAVVAEEVRNLAGRSQEASSQTADMIEDAIAKIQRGAQLATDTEEALRQVSEFIERITGLSENIATASEEQALSASQIEQALTQVSQITQTNSATSQECAAASEELSGQARSLNRQLSRFKLSGDDYGTATQADYMGLPDRY